MTNRRKKEAIRNFMRENYSDQNLASLLAHARDGKLVFRSCCCFIGIPTANHALRGRVESCIGLRPDTQHYYEAKRIYGSLSAELAYMWLAGEDETFMFCPESDPIRRRILIPMVRAEMKRRDFIRASTGIRQENPSLALVG